MALTKTMLLYTLRLLEYRILGTYCDIPISLHLWKVPTPSNYGTVGLCSPNYSYDHHTPKNWPSDLSSLLNSQL